MKRFLTMTVLGNCPLWLFLAGLTAFYVLAGSLLAGVLFAVGSSAPAQTLLRRIEDRARDIPIERERQQGELPRVAKKAPPSPRAQQAEAWEQLDPQKVIVEIPNPDSRLRIWPESINHINAKLRQVPIAQSDLDGLRAEREALQKKIDQLPPSGGNALRVPKKGDAERSLWINRIHHLDDILRQAPEVAKLPAQREALQKALAQIPPMRTGTWEEIMIGDDPGVAGGNENGVFHYQGYLDQYGQRNLYGYEKTIGLWYDTEFSVPEHNLFWLKAQLIFIENGQRKVWTRYFTYHKGQELQVSEHDWTSTEKRDYVTVHVTYPK
jgi:hypothetical protein